MNTRLIEKRTEREATRLIEADKPAISEAIAKKQLFYTVIDIIDDDFVDKYFDYDYVSAVKAVCRAIMGVVR